MDSRGDWGKLRGQSCLAGLHSLKGTAEGLLGLYNLFPPPPHPKKPHFLLDYTPFTDAEPEA